jgi:hypothetical protein
LSPPSEHPGNNEDQKCAEAKENPAEDFFVVVRIAQGTASRTFPDRVRNPMTAAPA